MQEKEGAKIPTEADIKALISKVKAQKMPKYRITLTDKPLLTEIPRGGKILTEREIKEIGATEIVYLNGAKVILKATDFHNDEVLFSAFSKGGASLYDIKDENNANYAGSIVANSGIGPYNQVELERYLTGKNISISPNIWEGGERLSGSAGAKDIETTLQMIYLYFMQPKMDKAGFDNFLAAQKMFMGNKNLNPSMVLADTVGAVLANYHPRRLPTEYEDLVKIDTKRALEIYKERFSASDFTFIFVGKFDINMMKRWAMIYIGSMPGNEKKENFKDLGIPMAKGEIKRTVYKGTEPKSTVKLVFRTENTKNDRQTRLTQNALVQVLNIKLREMIREEKGGTYGVRVSGSINSYPKLYSSINVEFGCDPSRSEELANAAISVIQKIQKGGVKEEDLMKVKETQRRELETSFKENRSWLNMISTCYQENLNVADLASFETLYQFTQNIKLEDIQRASTQYLNLKDYAKFILLPEKK
jgi:zinc protease